MNSRFDDTARKYREEMLKLYRNSSQFRPEPPTPVPPKQNPPEPPCSKEVQRMEFRKEEIKKDFPIRKNTGRLPTAPPPDDNEIIAVQGRLPKKNIPNLSYRPSYSAKGAIWKTAFREEFLQRAKILHRASLK